MATGSTVRDIAEALVGPALPIRITTPEGEQLGNIDAASGIVLKNAEAIRHLVRAPGELGFARAYVSGALDIEGSIWDIVSLQRELPDVKLQPATVAKLTALVGLDIFKPLALPPEEVRSGRTWTAHTKRRDAASISHHYDVGNDFYELVLGPSMTYSCAVFEGLSDSLDQAQANKYELICRKLGLEPGMRLLDVGCGWGGMVLHAASHHGVQAVGVTISTEQAARARKRVADAGLERAIEIRIQDYRDLNDGPFDAISSIGMTEHVGLRQLRDYFDIMHGLLSPQGRLLNHQIGRRPQRRHHRWSERPERTRVHTRGFVHRYVFPDGELHEVGDLIGVVQRAGLEVRHMESLREHYALTLRHWVQNLETHWEDAVALVGEGRVRVWHLYMAASAELFAVNRIQIHQVLATKTPVTSGEAGFPLRHQWDRNLRVPLGANEHEGEEIIDLRDGRPTVSRSLAERPPIQT